MNLIEPGGPLSQLSNLSFFFAAVFGDVLLIRLFLSLAYVFLFAAAFTGLPRWPEVSPNGNLFLDTVIWAAVSGSLHILALIKLLLDERPISFNTEDEEQLWRFFYRRSGIGRLEMKQVLKYGRWRRISAGRAILDPVKACNTLCLLVEGVAEFTAVVATNSTAAAENSSHINGKRLNSSSSTLKTVSKALSLKESGSSLLSAWAASNLVNAEAGAAVSSKLLPGFFFDMRLMNIFGLFIGFEGQDSKKWFAAVAKSDCLIYEWTIEELNTMATQMGPAVSSAWRNLIATQVSINFSWREMPSEPPMSGTGKQESPAILLGVRSRDFTDPLRSYESGKRRFSCTKFVKWLWTSLHPLMPPGVRHTGLPIHGIMARNRIITLKESQLRRVVAAKNDDGEGAIDEEEEFKTLKILRRLETLRTIEDVDIVELARDVSNRNRRSLGSAGNSLNILISDNSVQSDPGPSIAPPSSPLPPG